MLGYPELCRCLQTYTGITQDNSTVADAAPPAITSASVPAAMLISSTVSTPSPSLQQSGDMPT